jgi:hypothetical protein
MSSRRDTPDEEFVDDDDEIINQQAGEEDEDMTPAPDEDEPEDEVCVCWGWGWVRANRGQNCFHKASNCTLPRFQASVLIQDTTYIRVVPPPSQAGAQALPDEKKEIARQERERLRLQEQQKREALERLRAEQNLTAAKGEELREQNRLQFLLRQAEIFQHFAPGALDKAKKQGKRSRGRHAHDEGDEDAELLRDEEADGAAGGHRCGGGLPD